MLSLKQGLGWLMMTVAGLVLFVSVLAVLEQLGWGRSEEIDPIVIVTMIGIFGAGVGLGALGAYLAFSWRRAG
jgi:hypothetical protein